MKKIVYNNILLIILWVSLLECSQNIDESIVIHNTPSVTIMPLSKAFAKNSINTPIYRANSIVSDDNYQIATYYNESGNVVFAKRKVSSQEWDIYITDLVGNCNDAHNSISIGLDGDGYIHLSYNQHSAPLMYRKSISPYSFDFSENQYMISEIEEQKVTYPEFYRKSNGNLLFAYRTGYSGNGNLVINEYDKNSHKWVRVQDNLLGGEGQRNAYWQMYLDNNDCMFLSWVWRESADVATNHDLCYAKSFDCINWMDSFDRAYTLPISEGNSEIAWKILPSSELINQTSMAVDTNGHPYIATYWRMPSDTVPNYYVVSNNGSFWICKEVYKRITPFSLSGIGTKRVPISRPKIIIDRNNRAFFIFRDVERGEVASMAYCEDIENPEWGIIDLTDFSVDSWEPSIDMDRWKRDNVLDIYVQKAGQGDGEQNVEMEPQMAYIIEIMW